MYRFWEQPAWGWGLPGQWILKDGKTTWQPAMRPPTITVKIGDRTLVDTFEVIADDAAPCLIQCPNCKGEGVLVSGRECPSCKGCGIIWDYGDPVTDDDEDK